MSDTLAYTRGSHILRLLGVRNYLNNYFAMYKHLTRSRVQVELATLPNRVRNYLNNYCTKYRALTCSSIRVELACPAYLGLGII